MDRCIVCGERVTRFPDYILLSNRVAVSCGCDSPTDTGPDVNGHLFNQSAVDAAVILHGTGPTKFSKTPFGLTKAGLTKAEASKLIMRASREDTSNIAIRPAD